MEASTPVVCVPTLAWATVPDMWAPMEQAPSASKPLPVCIPTHVETATTYACELHCVISKAEKQAGGMLVRPPRCSHIPESMKERIVPGIVIRENHMYDVVACVESLFLSCDQLPTRFADPVCVQIGLKVGSCPGVRKAMFVKMIQH